MGFAAISFDFVFVISLALWTFKSLRSLPTLSAFSMSFVFVGAFNM